MIHPDRNSNRATGSRILFLLLTLVLCLAGASSAQAEDCSVYTNETLDGFQGTEAPDQLNIDINCRVQNYTVGNEFDTNVNFNQPGHVKDHWLVIFDNVIHTGQMSCNAVHDHLIWFTNGSSTGISETCQNYFIPVEKIAKTNPPGPGTVIVGVPFTYTLTLPVLFDPTTGTVINDSGSENKLHAITVWDDLKETGVDLTYVSHYAYWKDTNEEVVPTFSNVDGLLTFDDFPNVDPGRQIILEITVVLEDTETNSPGTTFQNTAKWDFGRVIDGTFYEPLPGEWGISDPLTIASPDLVMQKTGPATLGLTLNLGQWGVFGLDIENTGLTDAWDVTIVDQLPDETNGGMCNLTPQILSVEVFDSSGTGKGSLVEDVDYTVDFTGPSTCELRFDMLTAAAVIGPGEHLVISYRTQLDPDTQDGVLLTNVAGATRWFSGDVNDSDRREYTRELTDGTTDDDTDHEDAHTVISALYGYFFEKTVANLDSGADPATFAVPGDRLLYTLRLQATDVPLSDLSFRDDLGLMNALTVFEPGSLQVVDMPPNAVDNSDANGGPTGEGLLEVNNLSVVANDSIVVQFEIELAEDIPDGTIVLNQADLVSVSLIKIADSDDPNVNGQADPDVEGDEDPTQIEIGKPPIGPLLKETTQPTASIGEPFTYVITVPETPYPYPIYDVVVTDDLGDSDAVLRFLSVRELTGTVSWTPENTGTDTALVIQDTTGGIDLLAGEQAFLEITVVLEDDSQNQAGLPFTNTASFVYFTSPDDTTPEPGEQGESGVMTIVEPELNVTKLGPATMTIGTPGTFTLNVENVGGGAAWNTTLTDLLPDTASGGTCDTAPASVTAQVFDGGTPVSDVLVEDTDYSIDYDASGCLFTLTILSDEGTIGPGQRLFVSYEIQLDEGTQDGASLTNYAGAVEWFSSDDSSPDRHTHSEVVTDGTPEEVDHEDDHTVLVALPSYLFRKTVANLTTEVDPTTTARPGDTLLYRLEIQNTGDIPLTELSLRDEIDALNTPPAFESGTLAVVTLPGGTDNTDDMAGTAGTGVLDITDLSLDPGESLLVEFQVVLAPVLPDGMLVTNQSQLLLGDVPFAVSDDPGVDGDADPFQDGDENPTQVLIESAPDFLVEKVSAYIDGDPNILLAGERLQYTITVKNVGNADATGVVLRDQVPVNTQYVADSTTLNGVAVPDGPSGSPLVDGLLIHAPPPEDQTPGVMRADASETTSNVATIVFEVLVDPGVPEGSVISNQAFVSAIDQGVSDDPSDDPDTPVPDDPTRDVVGFLPLLFAPKSVTSVDNGTTPGIVDPGDTLHYTITIYNSGAVAATGVVVTDAVPADTTYVAGSTTLNGLTVPDAPSGSPLAGGIPVSSSDLTPPLPGPGEGTVNPGQSAVIEFDVLVDDGVLGGTIISNQAVVSSNEVLDLPTDGDGDPATGPEPTLVVVGDAQQLSITKDVVVVGGGPALPGSQLEYVVRVVNIAAVPAYNVVITDDLDVPVPGQLAYVDPSATLNGSTADVSVVGALITADYSGSNGPLQPNQAAVLRFRALVDSGLAIGTTVTNTGVVTWGDSSPNASASVSVDLGGVPGVGLLSGAVWHDADFDRILGAGERVLAGWTVELLLNGQPLQSVVTDAAGTYQFGGVPPNDGDGADGYQLRFRAPGAGANSAALGRADSPFTNGPQQISDIFVASGGNLEDLNLPIDPNGVVYDALGRTPVAGASLTLLAAGSGLPLPTACFDDPVQQGQVTLADGYYKFDLDPSEIGCGAGSYLLGITAPSGYVSGPSQIIPPLSDATTAPFSVPTCPGSIDDAVPLTPQHCEVQASESAPPASVPPSSAGTTHHLHLLLDATQMPGSSQIFNNHVPLDPELDGAVGIAKTTPSLNVSRGQLVPYEITLTNELGTALPDLSLVDRFPAGFRYVKGSARVDGVPLEPTVDGQELLWADLGLPGAGRRTVALLLAVGAGVSEGKYVNRAQAVSSITGLALSGEATATVRVVPDPTFSCTDVMGKVFDDANRNGVQDPGEPGLPGVRLVTARGLTATTDPFGRYHLTCAVTPNDIRGTNFVLKLDDQTLPTGYRMSTRQLQVQRATAGKALRLNYAASIHRVVALDLADAVFEPGSTALRLQWRPRIDLLLRELEKAPATLRLSYIADVEDEGLVGRRLDAIQREIADAWKARDLYDLDIEREVFWRRGAPPERTSVRGPDGG